MARSARVMTAAAAPSLTPQQSKSPSGQAIIGALTACSSVISRWKWALGLSEPLWWFLTAICPRSSLPASYSRPYLAK